jgi:hypothetical protein
MIRLLCLQDLCRGWHHARWHRTIYHYLVLAVHASLDLTTLNERNDFVFDLVDTPTKRRCHAVEANRLEWLKVEYDGRVPQMLSDIVHVDS